MHESACLQAFQVSQSTNFYTLMHGLTPLAQACSSLLPAESDTLQVFQHFHSHFQDCQQFRDYHIYCSASMVHLTPCAWLKGFQAFNFPTNRKASDAATLQRGLSSMMLQRRVTDVSMLAGRPVTGLEATQGITGLSGSWR